MPLNVATKLLSLPPIPRDNALSQVQSILKDPHSPVPALVILDDDPTGTQTCNNVPVLMLWDTTTLANELSRTSPGHGFFILTNSRALSREPAESLIIEILTNLKEASATTGIPIEIVLRSDSTLRGHFPLEVDVAERLLGPFDACFLCPFFYQGGRYTIDDVHYVVEGNELIPVAETPFAQDATFGYRSSNLREYVEEKTLGRISAKDVASFSLDTIRNGGSDAVLRQILELPKGAVVVANAANDNDIHTIVLATLQAVKKGKKFVDRTGAAFVSSRLGIGQIPPISATQLQLPTRPGGLIIAGSYVPKTTAQLQALIKSRGEKLAVVELQVQDLLDSPSAAAGAILSAVKNAEREVTRGCDILVMTSRKLITGSDEQSSLAIGSAVAAALVQFLVQLKTRPRYVIAKGGITSSDMATRGLRMKRALVVGQAAVGVPLWRCDEESCNWPGLPYVVFPGNVGGENTLLELVEDWGV
ncbi:hypothetical protein BHE90_016093 [Fusarium euwallaceae]|uniref:Four-carbon acid sugar kinase nucleotide binding domain-containing protein n=1 Tax=Fusarium euwallaceae TaxID=1147111 RepID=A0A430L1D1_9HYPO|nr:hypothetical protein BHE90_016093 [Fusarium euwallaceae]